MNSKHVKSKEFMLLFTLNLPSKITYLEEVCFFNSKKIIFRMFLINLKKNYEDQQAFFQVKLLDYYIASHSPYFMCYLYQSCKKTKFFLRPQILLYYIVYYIKVQSFLRPRVVGSSSFYSSGYRLQTWYPFGTPLGGLFKHF